MSKKGPYKKPHTIAFYNLENFFDTVNDPYTLDDDFTPAGFKKWTPQRFKKKAKKLARAIAKIGVEETQKPPVLIGIAEVENKNVIEYLLAQKPLSEIAYDYVHFDSPDERGIDTALLYHKDHFEVLQAEMIPLIIDNLNGDRDLTRDILYVKGQLHAEEVHIFVNHWPSRRDGAEETQYKRIKAAEEIMGKMKKIADKEANLIVMGDFNDDPNAKSIEMLMKTGKFINPWRKLLSPVSGSANYKGVWSLFDQILLSHSFLNHEPNTHSFQKAAIFSPRLLKEWKGSYKGNPFRTFAGKKYLGGYSDHFPVYVILKEQ
ncbi:endonuclease/exonuclease/phosphatase family protein [Allomuricauda sp. SCSIO 65647]|uniref:endonuclease/exonuclease/phosphatase family protein n=1 Tax=Allomuricauda sp. SCSIO 65647 TaxID=2908843 RepID=UPI001F3B93B2|nr:endonuclease/exonuclease/phosphatase family protein [Muricauda sp. SCSIO 65647]UJH68953.1 endonuclease [Muricauda sp. SCSIO 65647]